MKKPYEKPQLIALSLKANDALCACDVDAVEPNMDENLKRLIFGMENPFAEDGGCKAPVIGYCKMASTSILFNS